MAAGFRSEDVAVLLQVARDATLGSTFRERLEAISDALAVLIPSSALSAIVLDLDGRAETPANEIYYRNGRLADLVPYTSHYIHSDPMLPAIPKADGESHLLSDFVGTREFGRDPFTADYLKVLNVRHVMGCSHRMPNGQLLSLAFHRERRLRDFTARERKLLHIVSPVIARAAFGALLQEQVTRLLPSSPRNQRGACVFDSHGEIVHADEAGRELARDAAAAIPQPGSLRAIVRRLGKRRDREGESFDLTLEVASGSWLRVRSSALGPEPAGQVLAIMERLLPGSRDLANAIMNRARLTLREREIAGLAVESLANRQIALKLGITSTTVNVTLGHAYAKLGVTGRHELTSLLLTGRARDVTP